MNWQQIKGGWKRMTSMFAGNGEELTDEELAIVADKRDQLIAFLQENYHCEKKQAEQELDRFTRNLATARNCSGNHSMNERTGSVYHSA